MTRAPFVLPKAGAAWSRTAEIYDTTIGWRFVNPVMRERYGTDSMPETAEIVAERARDLPGRPGRCSRCARRSARPRRSPAGRLAREIAPVPDPAAAGRAGGRRRRRAPAGHLAGGAGQAAAAHSRAAPSPPGTRRASTTAPPPCWSPPRTAVRRYGLEPLARVDARRRRRGAAPEVMGIGPVPATQKLLARTGLGIGRPGRGRAERGVRRAGPGRAAAARPARRRRARQPERRRDRAGPPAGRQRRPARPDRRHSNCTTAAPAAPWPPCASASGRASPSCSRPPDRLQMTRHEQSRDRTWTTPERHRDRSATARDYLDLDCLFTAEELALRDRVRAFVDERIRPNIAALVRGRALPARARQGDGRPRPARHAPEGLRLRRPQRRRVRPGRDGAGGRRLRPPHLRLACRARWR